MKNYTESEQAWLALREYSPSTIYIGSFELIRTSVEVSIEHSDPEQTLYRGTVEYLSPTAGGATDKAGGGGGGGKDTDLPTNSEAGKKQDDQSDAIEEEDPAKIFFTYGTKQVTRTHALAQNRWEADEDGDIWKRWSAKTDVTAINKDGDDVAPEGVSIPDATMFMHVRHVRSGESMTPDFYRLLRIHLYSVNAFEFGYWKAGTVQFIGAELTPMKSGDYKCEFKFEVETQEPYLQSADYPDPHKFIDIGDGNGEPFQADGKNLKAMVWSPFNYTWFSYNTIARDTKVGGAGSTEADTFVRKCDSVNNAQVYQLNRWMGDERQSVFGAMNRAAKKLDPDNWTSYIYTE
tara:strand:+ start:5798 stop:6841 length:1044 start_codon:yes stop_codon:yes gene_type:complete